MNTRTFEFSAYDDAAIEDAIRRHREKGVTDTDLYRALVEEHAKRSSKSLSVEKTVALLKDAAQQKHFVSYKDVAEASGIEFGTVRWQVGKHLDAILELCHSRRWPLLTALCVKQNEVATGDLSGGSLDGFVAGARRLGLTVTDDKAFLRECQAACFAWAEGR